MILKIDLIKKNQQIAQTKFLQMIKLKKKKKMFP